jgi:hypothetical protein
VKRTHSAQFKINYFLENVTFNQLVAAIQPKPSLGMVFCGGIQNTPNDLFGCLKHAYLEIIWLCEAGVLIIGVKKADSGHFKINSSLEKVSLQ